LERGPKIFPNVRPFIPIQSEPPQTFVDCGGGFFGITRAVGILDAQNEGAAVMPGEEPVKQRSARSADVQITRGRWSKADTDRIHGNILAADAAPGK